MKSFLNQKSIIAATLSLILPGLGHAYLGRRKFAVIAAALMLGGVLAFYDLAASSGWFVLTGALGLAVFYLATLWETLRAARDAESQPGFVWPLAVLALSAYSYLHLIVPNERVEFMQTSTNLMEPTVQLGDHLALDRFHDDYKPGDLVALEAEDHSLDVRRVQSVATESIVLTTDNPTHTRVEQVPRALVRGKVRYVLYSVDPENSKPVWNRFFAKLN